jgi:hypothetical protein
MSIIANVAATETAQTFHLHATNGASFVVPNIYEPDQTYQPKGFFSSLEVLNVDGGGTLYIRVDGEDAEVGENDNYVVPAVSGASILISLGQATHVDVSVIADNDCEISLTGR